MRKVAAIVAVALAGCATKPTGEGDPAAVAAVAVIGAIALAGGPLFVPLPKPKPDTAWDWDEHYNGYGDAVWTCRGVESGREASIDRCADKQKTDARWPGK